MVEGYGASDIGCVGSRFGSSLEGTGGLASSLHCLKLKAAFPHLGDPILQLI